MEGHARLEGRENVERAKKKNPEPPRRGSVGGEGIPREVLPFRGEVGKNRAEAR